MQIDNPSTSTPGTERWRLGSSGRFSFDLTARTLYEDGRPVALGARALDVLAALVLARGEPVSKERLLERAWPGLVVEEANVHVQMSQLRKRLGADAVATVPSLGYRLSWTATPIAESGPRHNLPAERSSFVGRSAWLERGLAALQATRMLSLVGIGGAGKTRLALRLARHVAVAYADGVWWTDLAALDRADDVPHAVARALGVPLHGSRDIGEEVMQWLQPRQLLLVLDNCEHVVAATARLADAWLEAAPGLKIVATSREALAIEGECVMPVGPLALPGSSASPDDIAANEAVQLLIERAAAAAPHSSLGPADTTALAAICRRVDGIPLAIEIAASQLRLVSPRQLLDLLEERFRLLAHTRHALPRQQTMQAVITWSFEHLEPGDRTLLLALALCSGGCDLHAAQAVMGSGTSRVALMGSLTRLAEQSLMSVEREPDGDARYVLLETVRQFALDRLADDPLAAELRQRHAGHYLAMAEEHDREITARGHGAATLDRMDRERGNLVRAFETCERDDDETAVTAALRLAGALRHYWVARSQVPLGLQVTEAAVRRAGPSRAPDLALLLALVGLAQLQSHSARVDAAVQTISRVVDVARTLGEREHLAGAHGWRAGLLDQLGRFDEAAPDHEANRRIALQLGDDRLLADALSRSARQAAMQLRFDDAASLLAQALPLRRKHGHGYRLAVCLLNCGSIAGELKHWSEARDFLAETADLLAHVGSNELDAFLVDRAARLLHREGCWKLLTVIRAAERHQLERAGALPDIEAAASASEQLREARSALGRAAFDDAWREGTGLSIAQARERSAAWLRGASGDEVSAPT